MISGPFLDVTPSGASKIFDGTDDDCRNGERGCRSNKRVKNYVHVKAPFELWTYVFLGTDYRRGYSVCPRRGTSQPGSDQTPA